MTREDAIEVLEYMKAHAIADGFEEALDMAIDALQDRPQGEWIDYTDDGYVECPFCHNATNCDDNKEELHFCFSCGAYMRGEEC